MAQLVERTLPTPKMRSLNPDVGKILSTNCTIEKMKIKNKRLGMAHLRKTFKFRFIGGVSRLIKLRPIESNFWGQSYEERFSFQHQTSKNVDPSKRRNVKVSTRRRRRLPRKVVHCVPSLTSWQRSTRTSRSNFFSSTGLILFKDVLWFEAKITFGASNISL